PTHAPAHTRTHPLTHTHMHTQTYSHTHTHTHTHAHTDIFSHTNTQTLLTPTEDMSPPCSTNSLKLPQDSRVNIRIFIQQEQACLAHPRPGRPERGTGPLSERERARAHSQTAADERKAK